LNATFNGDVWQIEQGIQMKVHRPQPSKRALLYYCHKEPRRVGLDAKQLQSDRVSMSTTN